MARRFRRHFTLAEARALLPEIRRWIAELQAARGRLLALDDRLAGPLGETGDQGGAGVDEWIRTLDRLQSLFAGFRRRGIQLQDPDRGLIDFPALRGRREILLCWECGEPDIAFWHDLETGYAGREPL